MKAEIQSVKDKQQRIMNVLCENQLPGLFFTIIIFINICRGNYRLLFLFIPLVIFSLWKMWKSGRLGEFICSDNIGLISGIAILIFLGCSYDFSGLLKDEPAFFIIPGLGYAPGFIELIREFYNSIRDRP